MPDIYETLGISPLASLDEARSAFKRLAQIYHPDRFVNAPDAVRDEAERRMRELNSAFASLIARRSIEDQTSIGRQDPGVIEWWQRSERRRAENQGRAERYRRWDDLERARREREDAEARALDVILGRAPRDASEDPQIVLSLPDASTKTPKRARTLAERLKEASGRNSEDAR
jgi:curved DNA-binding protein CbpA